MYYAFVVDKLAKMGLSKEFVREYTGVRVYTADRIKKSVPLSSLDIIDCRLLAKWGMPLHQILERFPGHAPDGIYCAIKEYLCPLDAVAVYQSCIKRLRAEWVRWADIPALVADECNGKPSLFPVTSMIADIAPNPKRPENNRELSTVKLIKYIHTKNIPYSFRGFFHLLELFPDASQRTISKAMFRARGEFVRTCNLCGKEFVGSRQQVFCKRCRGKL